MRHVLIFLILLSSCAPGKESVMPFRNMAYSGERLFPISASDAEAILRVWFNNGTSLDRVITVSRDSLFGNQCKLAEFGFLSIRGVFKPKTRSYYNEKEIKPKSGY